MSSKMLRGMQRDLKRLQEAGHGWHRIGLVLFNSHGSYAAKVLSGAIVPSKKAVAAYEIWRSHDNGNAQEASPELQEAVWHYLSPGKEFSSTSQEMGTYFLIQPRKIRTACANLRDRRYPVGSGPGGYYEITEAHEKDETIRHLLSREREIRKRRIALSRAPLKDGPGCGEPF